MICKRIHILSIFILSQIALSTKGQTPPSNKPTTETQVPFVAAQPFIPSGYVNAAALPLVNYVRQRDGMARILDASAFDNAGYKDVKQTTTFVDGLGRPFQIVQKQITSESNPVDIATPAYYDAFGREAFKFLPYAVNDGNASDGQIKLDPFNSQKAFFQNIYPNEQPAYTGEKFYYSKVEYDNSPLNRVAQTLGAGNSWVGSGNAVRNQYLVNNGNDNVVIWNISNDALTFSNNDISTNIPTANGYYPAGALNKSVTTDEQGHSTVEYKDKDGLLILKKVQVGVVASDLSGYDGWLSTYYIYDDLSQLRFVIQPKGVSALQGAGWNLSFDQTVINGLCFRYEFDIRNRMTAKKVPGAGWVYMVYDQRDRLVYTQDANMRTRNQWLTTLYDGLNRPTATGMIVYTGTRDDLQTYVTANTGGVPRCL